MIGVMIAVGKAAKRLIEEVQASFDRALATTVWKRCVVAEQVTPLEVETFGESRSALEVSVDGPLAISDCVYE